MSELDDRRLSPTNEEARKQHMESMSAADEALRAAEASIQIGRRRLLNAMRKYEQRGRPHGVPKRSATSL